MITDNKLYIIKQSDLEEFYCKSMNAYILVDKEMGDGVLYDTEFLCDISIGDKTILCGKLLARKVQCYGLQTNDLLVEDCDCHYIEADNIKYINRLKVRLGITCDSIKGKNDNSILDCDNVIIKKRIDYEKDC